MWSKTLCGPGGADRGRGRPRGEREGRGGQGRGRAGFLLKKNLSGPDRVFCGQKPSVGQIGFFVFSKTLSGPDRVLKANSKPQTQPEGGLGKAVWFECLWGALGPRACWC